MATATEHLFSTQEAADLLGKSLRTVQRWVRQGRIRPARTFRGAAVFTGDELRRVQRDLVGASR